uniref:7TM_GPCR_Srx domain-containing protein n=1 Tax=Meloidogyne hapla TaxID=6305 RepID=A0A1I8BL24_MELHA
MAVLALNRFHAVFFVFSYQRLWEKKNVKYIIFTALLFTVVYSAVKQTIYNMGITTGILGFVFLKISEMIQ